MCVSIRVHRWRVRRPRHSHSKTKWEAWSELCLDVHYLQHLMDYVSLFILLFIIKFLSEIHIRHKIASRSEFSGSPPPQSPGAQSITSDGQRRDRFSSLQERYRQHQIAMKELDRQNSTSGWTQSSSTQVGFRFLICWFIANNPWSFICMLHAWIAWEFR